MPILQLFLDYIEHGFSRHPHQRFRFRAVEARGVNQRFQLVCFRLRQGYGGLAEALVEAVRSARHKLNK